MVSENEVVLDLDNTLLVLWVIFLD